MADWEMRVADLRIQGGLEDKGEFLKALGVTEEEWDTLLRGDEETSIELLEKLVRFFELDEEERRAFLESYYCFPPDNTPKLEDNLVTQEGKPVRAFSAAAAVLLCFMLLDAADGIIDGQLSIFFHSVL